MQDSSITSPLAKSPHASFSTSKKADFDSSLHSQNLQSSYLQQARGKRPRALAKKTGPDVSPDVSLEEVVIVSPPKAAGCCIDGSSKANGLRFKLLQFQENYRPAYYGTWQKKSSMISRRNPFRKDTVCLHHANINITLAPYTNVSLAFGISCIFAPPFPRRHFLTTMWTVTWSGRRRNQGRVFRAVRWVWLLWC